MVIATLLTVLGACIGWSQSGACLVNVRRNRGDTGWPRRCGSVRGENNPSIRSRNLPLRGWPERDVAQLLGTLWTTARKQTNGPVISSELTHEMRGRIYFLVLQTDGPIAIRSG